MLSWFNKLFVFVVIYSLVVYLCGYTSEAQLIVRKVNSTIHRIGIFSTSAERHKKQMTPGILNSQETKSDFNSKMLNCNTGFISY